MGWPRKGYWRTKDGRLLRLSEMEGKHLGNTLKMIVRSAELGRIQYVQSLLIPERLLLGDECFSWFERELAVAMDLTLREILEDCDKYRELRRAYFRFYGPGGRGVVERDLEDYIDEIATWGKAVEEELARRRRVRKVEELYEVGAVRRSDGGTTGEWVGP